MNTKKMLQNYFKEQINSIPIKKEFNYIMKEEPSFNFEIILNMCTYLILFLFVFWGFSNYDKTKYDYVNREFIINKTSYEITNFKTNFLSLHKYLIEKGEKS